MIGLKEVTFRRDPAHLLPIISVINFRDHRTLQQNIQRLGLCFFVKKLDKGSLDMVELVLIRFFKNKI